MQIYNDPRQIRKIFNREIEKGEISGAQAAYWIEGKKQWHEICGMADMEKGMESSEDTIYRIYSMTKPITAVAAMILYEKGTLDLDAPVGNYLPEYNTMKIGNNEREQDVRGRLTVRSLLNMTSGIVYPDNDKVGKTMASIICDIEKNIKNNGGYSTREVVQRIADCPLAYEPESSWRYGFSADVLGAVLEEAAQMRLGELYQKEIFEHLDMEDTAFYVPEEKKKRFSQLYKKEGGELIIDSNFAHRF